MTSKPTLVRRLAAILALLSAVAAVAFLLSFWIHDFPVALITIAAVCGMAAGVWLALTRRGSLRAAGVVLVLCGFFGAIAALIWQDSVLEVVGFVVSALVGVAAARFASGTDTRTLQRLTVVGEPAPPPARPALLMNPWSGGGKVKRFDLVDEAKRRGIEPILLDRGLDLRELALGAVERGADALGMAGGDGSQAIVAQVAWEHDLPYVCVPAGTRNHLALDLGLDRDDVTGALDGYTQGIERTIDLATVNGKVFVNNVSLGIYAEIVQSDRYRDAKMKTAADMLPEMIGPDADPFDFEFDGPQGDTHDSAHLILVSNNPYRLTTLFGARLAAKDGHWPHSGSSPFGSRRHSTSRASCSTNRSAASVATRAGANGLRPSSRCARTNRSRPASTARRSHTTHPFASPPRRQL